MRFDFTIATLLPIQIDYKLIGSKIIWKNISDTVQIYFEIFNTLLVDFVYLSAFKHIYTYLLICNNSKIFIPNFKY